VMMNGLRFKVGRGFYEFTKRVKVQGYKEVIVQDRATGEMWTGDDARTLAGLPIGRDAKLPPDPTNTWRVFIQSTSANRKLLGGTKFLYEVQ
jgi:hypothetical protein